MPGNTALDKWMWRIAYLYLVLPFLLFALGWLKWYFSFPVVAAVVTGYLFSLRRHKEFQSLNFSKHKWTVVACFSLIVIWIFFSGIGQFSFQNGDHYARNAILKDLVENPWPLVYDFTQWQPFGVNEPGEYMLVYYIGHWMPAALFGKAFGLAAAHFFLFLWTILGVTLIFYFICRHLKKISTWLVLLFILFGGMDVIPSLIKGNYHPLLHLEWWHNAHQQFTSNTSLIYWVFNQTIAPWLVVAMLFNHVPKSNLVFLSALCFFYAPLPFIGLIPFVIYFLFRSKEGVPVLRSVFTFQNTLSAAVVALLMVGYMSVITAETNFNIYSRPWTSNLWFYVIEFLVLALLLLFTNKNKVLVAMVIVTLVLLSFIQYRHRPDLMMRASIPSLFVLMMLSAEQWIKEKRVLARYTLIILLLIGYASSLNEITRSVYYTGKYWYKKKIEHTSPGFLLLQPPDLFKGNNPVIVSTIGRTNSFFYTTFCRQSESIKPE